MPTIGYTDAAALTVYAAARGLSVTNADISLQRALDWLEVQPFAGSKLSTAQPLSWPRYSGAAYSSDPWVEYPNNANGVPLRVVEAQHLAALIFDGGSDPSGAIAPGVKRIKIGPIEKEYQDNAATVTLYPRLLSLLAPFIASPGLYR